MKIEKRILPKGDNFRVGRREKVAGIADHVTEGTAASVISWFNTPAADVSSHYMVQKDAKIVQFVEEADEAWAQGRVHNPTAKLVLDRPGKNPNSYLISIEHEGDGSHDLTDAQRTASAELHADIARRHGFPLDRTHVIGHHEVYDLKSCPGKIDLDRLVNEAQTFLTAPPSGVVVPPPPTLVYSEFFHDWLIVVRRVSDHDWYFVPVKDIGTRITPTKAQTPLSAMRTR